MWLTWKQLGMHVLGCFLDHGHNCCYNCKYLDLDPSSFISISFEEREKVTLAFSVVEEFSEVREILFFTAIHLDLFVV